MANNGINWSVSDRHAQMGTPANSFQIRAGTQNDRCFLIMSANDRCSDEDDLVSAMVASCFFPTAMLPVVLRLFIEGLNPLATVGCLAMMFSSDAR